MVTGPSVQELEMDVSRRLDSGKYAGNLSSFCNLLRYYQQQPASFNNALAARVLLATLPQLGDAEFTACLCLIPERLHDTAEIKPLVDLDDHLERGNFAAFWQAYAALKGTMPQPPKFDEAMRAGMARFLSLTFASIDGATAARMLNVASPAEAAKLVPGATIDGAFLVFGANEFNRPKPPPEPRDLTSANIATLVRAVCA
jgi:translation initiation factor 3 subunit K